MAAEEVALPRAVVVPRVQGADHRVQEADHSQAVADRVATAEVKAGVVNVVSQPWILNNGGV